MKRTLYKIVFYTIRRWFPDQYYKRQINRTKDLYREDLKKANNEDKQELIANETYEITSLRYELDEIKSDRALKKASKYNLLIPDTYLNINTLEISDDWVESNYGPIILSSKGRNKILKEYREEIRWRRERNMSYFSLIYGLVGSITGLLAIILNK
jgi:hypothetical protein